MAPITESAEQPSMILFLGVTGAGKSYMINQLAGQMNAEEGSSLDSCTQTCQLVPAQLGRTRVLLLDTPGFDDPKRDDAEILSEIARVLSIQRESGTELKGVIFIHSITLIRYTGSAIRIFEIVRKICGDQALKNVLLVTSRWSQVNQTDGSKRESQLREKFWAYMLAKGSNMSRFHGDRDSAIALVSQLLCKDNVVLELQTELSDEGKDLDMTVAGSFVRDNLGTLVVRYNEELAALEEAKQGFAQGDGAMERQYQIDWEDTLTRLKRAIDHQASLRRAIGVEECVRPVHNFDEHSPQSTPNDYDAHLSYNEQPPMTERSDWDTDGRNNLQQRNHRLEAELKSRGSQIAQLQEFIQQEKDKGLQSYERLECSLQLGPQVYDNAVQQKFDYLFASIKTWSSEFREFKKLSKCEAREFQAVLPSCTSLSQMNDLFAVNKKRRLFVRGWAAYIMSTKLSWLVEQDKSYRSWNLNQWLDETSAQSFSQIEEKLRSADLEDLPPREYNEWRAVTAELLWKSNGRKDFDQRAVQKIRSATKDVMDVVGSWTKPEKVQELGGKLYIVFEEAVHFSRMLVQQRAAWTVRFPAPSRTESMAGVMDIDSLMFDSISMKDEWVEDEGLELEKGQQQPVEMIVTPTLYKRGNMDGERFDQENVVAPAAVLILRP